MTTHRPSMRIEIRRCTDPAGRPAVLFQADEFHVVVQPRDAIELAITMYTTARQVWAEQIDQEGTT